MSRYIKLDYMRAIFCQSNSLTQAWNGFDRLPSIDIVRCKECKHNYNTAINHGKMQPRCDFTDWKLTENDYCSRGERREP